MDNLKGDNPKIWGIDYYTIIYGSAAMLALVMFYLYLVIDEPELKRMVMIQGFFAIGLLCASMFYRTRMSVRKQEAMEAEKRRMEDAARRAKARGSSGKRKRK